jgi:hypothetical protein
VYVNDYIAIDIRKGSRQIMGMCQGMVFSLLLKVKFLKKDSKLLAELFEKAVSRKLELFNNLTVFYPNF